MVRLPNVFNEWNRLLFIICIAMERNINTESLDSYLMSDYYNEIGTFLPLAMWLQPATNGDDLLIALRKTK